MAIVFVFYITSALFITGRLNSNSLSLPEKIDILVKKKKAKYGAKGQLA